MWVCGPPCSSQNDDEPLGNPVHRDLCQLDAHPHRVDTGFLAASQAAARGRPGRGVVDHAGGGDCSHGLDRVVSLLQRAGSSKSCFGRFHGGGFLILVAFCDPVANPPCQSPRCLIRRSGCAWPWRRAAGARTRKIGRIRQFRQSKRSLQVGSFKSVRGADDKVRGGSPGELP